jgi:hypothetical protein
MSAELLRRAAKELRERATAAVEDSPAPWSLQWDRQDLRLRSPETTDEYDEFNEIAAWTYVVRPWVAEDYEECERSCPDYIAMMHPPVALALADWLDAIARNPFSVESWTEATAVARAILREESTDE